MLLVYSYILYIHDEIILAESQILCHAQESSVRYNGVWSVFRGSEWQISYWCQWQEDQLDNEYYSIHIYKTLKDREVWKNYVWSSVIAAFSEKKNAEIGKDVGIYKIDIHIGQTPLPSAVGMWGYQPTKMPYMGYAFIFS